MSRSVRRAGLGAVLLALTGCAGTPPESPPTGVDGLTIPTPGPDGGDFTAAVDNRWFPLDEDATWTYRAADGSRVRLVVDGTATVAGVPVTTLLRTTTDAEGAVVGERRSAYAQDTAGNVWSFGRQVLSGPGESWLAGEDGGEAGLLVPAEPRRGDGWLQQRSPALTTRVEVLEVGQPVSVLGVEVEALVTRDDPDGVDPEAPSVTRYYAPGTGLVSVTDAGSGEVLLELTASSP